MTQSKPVGKLYNFTIIFHLQYYPQAYIESRRKTNKTEAKLSSALNLDHLSTDVTANATYFHKSQILQLYGGCKIILVESSLG